MAITVFLADDHNVVLAGYRAMLEREPDIVIVGECTDGREVMPSLYKHQPNVLVLDLSMGGKHGLDVLKEIPAFVTTGVVVSTMFDTAVYAQQALRSGARGYVTKQSSAKELVRAIREVASGGKFIAPESLRDKVYAMEAVSTSKPLDPYETLTDRERSVLRMVAEGASNQKIAEELGLSVRTVETHRKNMMAKMSFENQAALVKWACARGLIVP
jgi:DNA-binding NarL/FixJ family response regulator